MSDDDRDLEPGEGDDAPEGNAPEGEAPGSEVPAEEKGGLGLTEEFRRIEDEIQREVGGPLAGRGKLDDEPAPDEPAEEIPADVGRETDEWDAGEVFAGVGGGDDDGEAPEVDPAGGEADPPDPDEAPEPDAEVEPDDDAADPQDSGEESAAAEPDAAAPPSPADEPATEHTVVRLNPMPARSPASVAAAARGGGAPPPIADGDLKSRTPALWWRFLTASVLIVASTATAVAVSFLLFLSDVAADLQPLPDVGNIIDEIEPGDPQTILILGSDKRSDTPGDPGRSDTTMLLRVDAEQGVLSLFSLPRDLKVEIPGYGTGKLNEAYTAGGVKKTLKTVKNLTGLEINHVVNVDFQGFADAVDAIGCVYVDVDRDYFHSNEGLYGAETYAEINVNAGYQRLCGLNALDYVRFRHTDTDIVRAARQQDFLSQARRQVPVGEVIPIFGGDLSSQLIDIFTKYTRSDIRDTEQVIGTLKSFIAVRNVPIKQVSFEGTLGESYVEATPEQIDKAVNEFLGGEDTAGPIGGDSGNDKPEGEKADEKKKKSKGEDDPTAGSSVISTEDAAAACSGVDKFAAFGRTSSRRLKFPVFVPTAVVPGSCADPGSRQYDIKDLDDNKQPAYKLVVAYSTPSTLTEYYGVMGTTWNDPPILKDPSETREIDGRTYELHYDGDRLKLVAWHDAEGNSYWVSNTLLGTLGESDMLAIATSMDEAHG